MATIKKWRFDSETAALVDMSYSSKNGNKSVKKYDIIMARSGEGTIGKVALIEEDLKGIFADFTMRIAQKIIILILRIIILGHPIFNIWQRFIKKDWEIIQIFFLLLSKICRYQIYHLKNKKSLFQKLKRIWINNL